MSDTNRRLFLRRAAIGAASVGAVAGASQLFGVSSASAESVSADPPEVEPVELDTPLVALLRDSSNGEFSVMVGEREVTFTDKALAAQLSRHVAGDIRS